MNTKDSVSSIDHFAPAAGLLRWAEAQPGRRYENQAVIYHSGEDAGQFYCLIDGKVQIYMTSPEGIEKTITVYQNHALFGEAAFFDGSPRTTSARALVASRVVVIDRESILTCFREQPDLALSMICSLSSESGSSLLMQEPAAHIMVVYGDMPFGATPSAVNTGPLYTARSTTAVSAETAGLHFRAAWFFSVRTMHSTATARPGTTPLCRSVQMRKISTVRHT